MRTTKLAQMPNDLPMALGERLPRAEELRKEKAERDAAIKAYQRTAFFERADHTFNPCPPKAPPCSSQVFDSLAESFKAYQHLVGLKVQGETLGDLGCRYKKACGIPFAESIHWTWDKLTGFRDFCHKEAARARQALAEEEIGKRQAELLNQGLEAQQFHRIAAKGDRYNW